MVEYCNLLRGLCSVQYSYSLTMNKYGLEVTKRHSYIRAGKLWSRGRANSPKNYERALGKFCQQGGILWVLLIAMSELPGHEDSFLALCLLLVVRGKSGSGEGPRL